jgi:hypothetical protein
LFVACRLLGGPRTIALGAPFPLGLTLAAVSVVLGSTANSAVLRRFRRFGATDRAVTRAGPWFFRSAVSTANAISRPRGFSSRSTTPTTSATPFAGTRDIFFGRRFPEPDSAFTRHFLDVRDEFQVVRADQ